MALKVEIRRVFLENFEVYDVRKICDMMSEGFEVARCARLLRSMGLQGVIRVGRIADGYRQGGAMPLDHVKSAVPGAAERVGLGLRASWTGFVYEDFVIDAAGASLAGALAGQRMPSCRIAGSGPE